MESITKCTVSPWLPRGRLLGCDLPQRWSQGLTLSAATLGQAESPSSGADTVRLSSLQQSAQADEPSEPALCSCQQASCSSLATHGQALWDVQQNAQVRSNSDKSTEIPQQPHGVKLRAAGPARNSVRSYLGICTALPISSTLSINSSP